jgi:NAD(P)-dependent dehydrogenase (short-subunit alcohol dehydrogenase family)
MGDRLKGKVAIVTGAGSSGPGWGNGKAAAVLFAREGARVFGVDVKEAAIAETKAIIAAEGGSFAAHVADITDESQVESLFAQCMKTYGRVDVLHNNVGVYEKGSIETRDRAYWDRVNAINMTSMFLMCKHGIAQMVKQGEGGAVINLSSIAAIRGLAPDYSIYCVTKAAALGLTRSLAIEYAKHRIRVNAILPGMIDTPLALEPIRKRTTPEEFQRILGERAGMNPLGRAGTGFDVAKAALFLASEDADFITGIELVVDGGLSIKPF